MQTMAIDQSVQTALQGMRGLMGLQGMGGGQGAFASLLQQLLGRGGNPMDEIFANMQQSMEEGESEDGTDMGMMMLAEMLFSNPAALDPSMIQTILANGQNSSQVQNLLNRLPQNVLAQMMTADENQTQKDQPQSEQDNIFQMLMDAKAQTGETASGKTVLPLEQSIYLDGKFQNAVSLAQKMLKDQTGSEEQAVLDVDALQSDVISGKFRVAAQQGDALPDVKDLSEQLKTGILQNLSKGKNEFVVKLKPDGLGEILVRMREDADNKMTLSIITSRSDVAKLLNNEIGALRDSLRMLNADVRDVVSLNQSEKSSNENAGAFSQFSQFNEGPSDQRYQENRQASSDIFAQMMGIETDPVEEEAILGSSSALDAYI